jgi:hypothetical protein
MKEIVLTHGKTTMVDDWNYDWLMQWIWKCTKDHNTYYAIRWEYRGSTQTMIMMHREIMKTPMGLECDHQNRNGLDNQYENLRNCTHGQNMANRKSTGASKYLGVSFHKATNKFRANIRYDKKRYYLGNFKTEIEAAKAYNMAAINFHKEFANLNIIE